MLDRLEFLDRLTRFKFGAIQRYMPHRYHEEMYDHQTLYELSLWYGQGPEEIGAMFFMKRQSWDGSWDWKRIDEIMADRGKFITSSQLTHEVAWDMSDLSAPRNVATSWCPCRGR